jgi:3-hydroxyacyl-[acyl-carrier-protein] dehydratase
MNVPRTAPPAAAPLPYAAPLGAVDEIEVDHGPDGGLEVRATKDISAADRYLPAHFPGRVVYPGVFILETVRQAVLAAVGERAGRLPDLAVVGSMRLLAALRAGERLAVTAAVAAPDPAGAFAVRARCRRGDGADVATLTLEFRYEDSDA